jgi:hypothetical protein
MLFDELSEYTRPVFDGITPSIPELEKSETPKTELEEIEEKAEVLTSVQLKKMHADILYEKMERVSTKVEKRILAINKSTHQLAHGTIEGCSSSLGKLCESLEVMLVVSNSLLNDVTDIMVAKEIALWRNNTISAAIMALDEFFPAYEKSFSFLVEEAVEQTKEAPFEQQVKIEAMLTAASHEFFLARLVMEYERRMLSHFLVNKRFPPTLSDVHRASKRAFSASFTSVNNEDLYTELTKCYPKAI